MSLDAKISTDVAAFFPDFGVPVVYGAQSTVGIFDENDAPLPAAESSFDVTVRASTLLIKTGSLTDLAADAAITVNGRNFVIRRSLLEGDGKLTLLVLAPA